MSALGWAIAWYTAGIAAAIALGVTLGALWRTRRAPADDMALADAVQCPLCRWVAVLHPDGIGRRLDPCPVHKPATARKP